MASKLIRPQYVSAYVSEPDIEWLRKVGKGNLSEGIRWAVTYARMCSALQVDPKKKQKP